MSAVAEVIDLTEEVQDDEVQIVPKNPNGFHVLWSTELPIQLSVDSSDLKWMKLCRRSKYIRYYRDTVEYTDDMQRFIHQPFGKRAWLERNEDEEDYRSLRRKGYLQRRDHAWCFIEMCRKFKNLGILNYQVRSQMAREIVLYLIPKDQVA